MHTEELEAAGDSTMDLYEHWAACCLDPNKDLAPAASYRDGYNALLISLAICESGKTGEKVEDPTTILDQLRGDGLTDAADPACQGGETCTDDDQDGYGNPASGACDFPDLDCDDTNAAVNPASGSRESVPGQGRARDRVAPLPAAGHGA